MRQLVKHKKRTSVGRALLIISVGALMTLSAYGSGAGFFCRGRRRKKGVTLRIGMTALSGALSGA